MTPEQLAGKLTGLVAKQKRDVMQQVVLAGEAIGKREFQPHTKTGRGVRSITSRVERGGDLGRIGTNLPHMRMVHEGTRPHIIRPRRAKALFWKGARHPVKMVRHPGYRGDPFFVRTMQKLRPVAEKKLAAWGAKVWSGIR